MTNLRDAAQEHAYGLITEPQKLLNRMLQDYDPYLSLRRIPENDPAFAAGMQHNPPRIFGVWEETSSASTKWAFTIPEISIQNPGAILARVAAGDMTKMSGKEKLELLRKAQEATKLAERKVQAEKEAERREEMLFIASTAKSRITHTLNGEKLILGDTVRSARTHV